MKGDFERYLSAKATVDDRALDRTVLARFRDDVRARSAPRILEAGTGTAAFCRRFLSWDDLPDCTYVAVDTDPALLATARTRVLRAAREAGFRASLADPTTTDLGLPVGPAGGDDGDETGARDGGGHTGERGDAAGGDGPAPPTTVAAIRLSGPARIDVHLVAGDALTVAAGAQWDALVAQAFVDLLSPADVARLVSGVVDGGAVYLPITFGGGTAFEPSHPADDAVLDAYHATMVGDDGDRLGARAGRRLRTLLPEFGVDVAAVGESDWCVGPTDDAGTRERYPADEAYFLAVVVDTVADAVRGRVPDETVDAWLAARREQREAGALRFGARNLDLYGCRR
jgi:SAM-dependent methyltransferase